MSFRNAYAAAAAAWCGVLALASFRRNGKPDAVAEPRGMSAQPRKLSLSRSWETNAERCRRRNSDHPLTDLEYRSLLSARAKRTRKQLRNLDLVARGGMQARPQSGSVRARWITAKG